MITQIKTLPARYPVLGRVRFGEKEPVIKDGKQVVKNGKPVFKPVKGEHLRFTSDDEFLLKTVAARLGGSVGPWIDGEQAFQVTTESAEVECYLPPDPLDTAFERWGSGGCQRRCNGEMCTFVTEGPEGLFQDVGTCRCLAEGLTPGDREDTKKGACTVSVRIRVLLPDLPGIGVWMGTSHSIYAAMELPAQLAIIRAATAVVTDPTAPVLVPAVLAIDHREEKKPWEKYKREYIVPVLQVRASMMQLDALARGANGGGLAPARAADALAPARAELVAGPAEAPPTPVPLLANPAPPAQRSPARPTQQPPNVDKPRPWLRVIQTRARTPKLSDPNLDSVVEEATEGRVLKLIDLTEAADANAVMSLLGKLAEERETAS